MLPGFRHLLWASAAFLAVAPTPARSNSLSVLPETAAGPAIPVLAAQPRPGLYWDRFELAPGADRLVLSWRGLPWGSEAVYVGGIRLVRDRDYTLDGERGILRLAKPVAEAGLLDAYYRAPRLLAEPNLTLGAPEAAGPGPRRGKGRKARKQSLSERSREEEQPSSTALTERLAASLRSGESTSSAILTTSDGGAAHRSEPSPLRQQLQSGLRITEVEEQVAGGGRDSATYSYTRTDAVDPQLTEAAREEFAARLDLRPTPNRRVVVDTRLDRSSIFSQSYEEHERRRVQFEQTWGKSSAALMWERQRSDGYGVARALDSLSLALTHPMGSNTVAEGLLAYENSLFSGWETRSLFTLRQAIGRRVEAHANLLARGTEFTGSSLDTGLALNIQPSAGSRIRLQADQANSQQYGKYGRYQGEASLALGPRVQLTGESSRRTSEKYGEVNSTGVGMALRPTARMLLESAFSESVGDKLGRETARSVRMSYLPSSTMRLQLGYDLLSSSNDGSSANGIWLVSVGGRRYVKVEGYQGTREIGDLRLADATYRMEVRPVGLVAVNGSVRRVLSPEELRQVGGLGAQLFLAPGVRLAGTYRQPITDEPVTDEMRGHDLRLLVSPITGFRLFGQYSLRPEDDRGGLLDQEEQTVGVESQFGSLGLQGSVTSIQGVSATDPGRRSDLLASLSLGSLRLFGGLRTEDTLGLSTGDPDLRREIIRLGLTQSAGSSFFLTLEGQVGYLVGPGGRTWSPVDSRAQARLGLRF